MKNNSKKVSVCVPTYERVDMVRQLINSFIKQNYKNKELIISDDSNTSSILNLIKKEFSNVKEIHYYKNKNNLGYCKNLLNSIKKAKGEYIIILGDDDAFLSVNAIDKYSLVFDQNESVDYIYSNQIQFNNKLQTEYIFKFFKEDTLFKKGFKSLSNSWLSSIFIPGMGLRNNKDFSSIYPTENILFPQVYMVGCIINEADSFGISDILIAGRAHEDQLGFMAIKGKNIKDNEKHGTVEVFKILDDLLLKYNLDFPKSIIEKQIVNSYSTMILKEKMVSNNNIIRFNYNNFINTSEHAKKSIKLKLFYIIALLLPKPIIKFIRYYFIKYNQISNHKIFNNINDKLKFIVKI